MTTVSNTPTQPRTLTPLQPSPKFYDIWDAFAHLPEAERAAIQKTIGLASKMSTHERQK